MTPIIIEHLNVLSLSVLFMVIFAFGVYDFRNGSWDKWLVRLWFSCFCSGVIYQIFAIIAILWRGN